MLILFCHEMGHYLVARRHGIHASLPYFIPLPPVISLGTLGAVIRMDESIADRNKLLDVGAAGPLAGLAVAIPLLFYGISISPLTLVEADSGVMLEGNSILYLSLKYAVHGLWLPTDLGLDVELHPIAFAAWVGVLITMINLLPIGQLDGGHIAASALGEGHEKGSKLLHLTLPMIALGVVAWVASAYLRAGRELVESVLAGGKAALPWLVWASILVWMRRAGEGRYHPPVSATPLTPRRRVLVALMVLVLIAIFTPIPMREAGP